MRCLIISLLLATLVEAQEEEWVGRRFMPRINAIPTTPAGDLHWGDLMMPVVVKSVDGDWADIGGLRFRKTDLIALERAEPYFTEIVRLNPNTDRCYSRRAIVRKHIGLPDEAIEDYTTAIRLNPTKALHFFNRGKLWHYSKSNLDAALKDYNEAIRLDPAVASTFFARAEIFRGRGELDAALRDYDESIRLDPNSASALNNRGLAWKSKGDLAAAARDYEEAIRIDQNFPYGYSNLAWLLATATDPTVRDGKRAVLAGTVACKLTSWNEVGPVRALAAAYAEAGDFNSAIQEQTKALELISDKNKPAEQSRLKYYQAGKPYRDKPTKNANK